MVLTGRAALLAALGALVVGLAVPSVVGVLVVSGILLTLCLVDVALAGPVRPIRLRRSGDRTVRLGQSAQVTPARRQRRSATARGHSRRVAAVCGCDRRARRTRRRARRAAACRRDTPAHPTRRPPRRPSHHPESGAAGIGRPAGYACRSLDAPGAASVPLPPAPAVAAGPAAGAGRPIGHPHPWCRHRVRLVARVRRGRRHAIDRLAGDGSARRCRRADVATRTGPARAVGARHRPDVGRPRR